MKISKIKKFAQNQESVNVIEPGKENFNHIKGNWRKHFGNSNELVLELACGWGEYTTALGEKFPNRNFVGVDLKGDRIWRGSQYALANGLGNVAFLRTHIVEILNHFEQNEVDEIWLTFPDPQPKDRNEKHRLSNQAFLQKYKHILNDSGYFRFKTDSTFLFEYTLQVLNEMEIEDLQFTFDLYASDLLDEHHGITTKYEKIWTQRGEKIKYMKFRFKTT